MAKFGTIFFTLVLLLSFGLSYASRPNPGVSSPLHHAESEQTRIWRAIEGGDDRGFVPHKEDEDDESCEKAQLGTEECLMRRTLAAHTDYIYTQKHKP